MKKEEHEEKVFHSIPFDFDFEEFAHSMHIPSGGEMEEGAKRLVNSVLPRTRPKAIYRVSYITERSKDTIVLDNVKFASAFLSEALFEVERVFSYVATCGIELDEAPVDRNDLMVDYCIDALKDMALAAARKFLENYLKEEYRIGKMGSVGPGTGEFHFWPIQQQKELFSLLGDTQKLIGVTLTESFLMIPNKTVSGVFFPSEVNFEVCAFCSRENCPRHKARYRGDRFDPSSSHEHLLPRRIEVPE